MPQAANSIVLPEANSSALYTRFASSMPISLSRQIAFFAFTNQTCLRIVDQLALEVST